MDVLRSYVVRLYREGPAGVTGMVESVETGELVPFRSLDELWSALQRPPSQRRFPSMNPLQEEDP
jgi:hypothetical protein